MKHFNCLSHVIMLSRRFFSAATGPRYNSDELNGAWGLCWLDSLFAYQCTACSLEMLRSQIFCIKSVTQSTCFSFRSVCDIIHRPATPGWCSACFRTHSHHCSRLILQILSQEWSPCEVLLSRWALMGALPHSLADSSHLDHVGKVKVKWQHA